eukprot:TRINITY_DN2166_c0_g1_i2.p1 TRINITY_DN2166_c0_g1~~TRINITY_DN2166_c0_g1_i2.p1  ORF type:complete len:305 (+),score=96.22 TRINITY_DN2166_c0_g1_i2:73-915(+)
MPAPSGRCVVLRYGKGPSQFARVWAAEGVAAGSPAPVALLIHGGYWRQKYTIDNCLFDTIAPDLSRRGFIAVDVEYRRCGEPGGGWPGTNDDVLAALRALPGLAAPGGAVCDLSRIVVLGHSAGGCLALWLADAAARLRAQDPRCPVPCLVCAAAPVADLHLGHELRISDDGKAVEAYMQGSPGERPSCYLAASPRALLPLRVPCIVTVGDADDQVPPRFSTEFAAAAAAAGGPHQCRLMAFPGADHFSVVSAGSDHWRQTVAAVAEVVQRRGGGLGARL